jgi:hypothetical protein
MLIDKYSKQEVLIESVRTMFINDNANTGNTVREISHYVSNRIYRKYKIENKPFPQTILEVTEFESALGLPSGNYNLKITNYVRMDSSEPWTVLGNLTARQINLLDKNQHQLNLVIPDKKLRCRLIQKNSVNDSDDTLSKLYIKVVSFFIICDKENISCD